MCNDELSPDVAPEAGRRVSPFQAVGQPAANRQSETVSAESPAKEFDEELLSEGPETSFTPPDALQPCSENVQCDTIQCAILDGEQTCCECLIRRANGKCTDDGWFLMDTMDDVCPLNL